VLKAQIHAGDSSLNTSAWDGIGHDFTPKIVAIAPGRQKLDPPIRAGSQKMCGRTSADLRSLVVGGMEQKAVRTCKNPRPQRGISIPRVERWPF
jgi:hypothetical protein